MKELIGNQKIYLFGIIIVLCLMVSYLILHSIETTVNTRCDGKDIFPYTENNTIYEGQMKLSNAFMVNVFNSNIELYQPVWEVNKDIIVGSYVMLQKGCKYYRIGEWQYR